MNREKIQAAIKTSGISASDSDYATESQSHRSRDRAKVGARALGGAKLPFDIDEVLTAVRKAIAPYRKAALFELADAGFKSVFEQLVACIISIRTLDQVTVPTAERLFAKARTPA